MQPKIDRRSVFVHETFKRKLRATQLNRFNLLLLAKATDGVWRAYI